MYCTHNEIEIVTRLMVSFVSAPITLSRFQCPMYSLNRFAPLIQPAKKSAVKWMNCEQILNEMVTL